MVRCIFILYRSRLKLIDRNYCAFVLVSDELLYLVALEYFNELLYSFVVLVLASYCDDVSVCLSCDTLI